MWCTPGICTRPLLFIIYTNDLPKCLSKSKCILFADDTTIYKSGTDKVQLYEHANNDLHTLEMWFRANKLSLNVAKTNYMTFGFDNYIAQDDTLSLKIGTETIKHEEYVKFLGMYVDNKLKWSKHLQHCKAKIAGSIYIINCAKKFLNQQHLRTLYYSLVYPYLDYGIMLWGTTNKTYIKPLVIQQKKVIRIIAGKAYNASTEPIFKSLNILPIEDMLILQTCSFMYKFSQNTLPSRLRDIFTKNLQTHSHNTRRRYDPHITTRRTSLAGNTIKHNGPKLWNKLTQDIKRAKTLHSFKKSVKKIIANLK